MLYVIYVLCLDDFISESEINYEDDIFNQSSYDEDDRKNNEFNAKFQKSNTANVIDVNKIDVVENIENNNINFNTITNLNTNLNTITNANLIINTNVNHNEDPNENKEKNDKVAAVKAGETSLLIQDSSEKNGFAVTKNDIEVLRKVNTLT